MVTRAAELKYEVAPENSRDYAPVRPSPLPRCRMRSSQALVHRRPMLLRQCTSPYATRQRVLWPGHVPPACSGPGATLSVYQLRKLLVATEAAVAECLAREL